MAEEMRLTSEFPLFEGTTGMTIKGIEDKFGIEVLHYDSEPTYLYDRKPSSEIKVHEGNYIKVRGDYSKVCSFSLFNLQ